MRIIIHHVFAQQDDFIIADGRCQDKSCRDFRLPFPVLKSVVAEHVAVYGGDNRRFTTQRLP